MTIMIQEQRGRLIKEELEFFLKGNTSLESQKEEFSIDWLSEF